MTGKTSHASDEALAAAIAMADRRCIFGPSFFLARLPAFVRDSCPDPGEHLPLVHVHLGDGNTLDLCHIIGVSPHWVMFAVRDNESHGEGMVVEIVPYELIQRLSIRTRRGGSGAIGFTQAHAPAVMTAEALMQELTPHSVLDAAPANAPDPA